MVGLVLEKMLYAFIIRASETDTMMIYIIILFTAIVMIIMHVKSTKVNMINELKSN
ncbi:hypothetical protein [Clostridium perfringens]|uniref:hypothetical protein n=1 Tax=Clostridium perfringens TaxID=1502 RepID=UPI0024BC217B|nr:hypothetical protein [Clostridium perfringens]